MVRPFRVRYGLDLHDQKGINCADPQDEKDVANKTWTEQRIADGSRYRGEYDPDDNGEGDTVFPPLRTYQIGVPTPATPNRAQTADYWIVSRSAQNRDDIFKYRTLTTGDRITALESDSAVQFAWAQGGANIPNLKPNWNYYVQADSPNGGRGLGLHISTDASGEGFVQISNRGQNYVLNETFPVTVESSFNNTIAATGNQAPQPFNLDPDTTYYDVLVTGGTGDGVIIDVRTDATGTVIDQLYLIKGGTGYADGDVLTITVESQVVGTVNVTSVFTGTDQTFTCQVLQMHSSPELTFDLVKGSGLTKQQADLDYLRLDGSNKPSKDVSWNNLQIKDLGDPLDPQDAVNLRTLRNNAGGAYYEVTQVAHGYALGDPLYLSLAGTWQLAIANDAGTNAWGICNPIDADNFYLFIVGELSWPAHGFTLGAGAYLSQTVAGGYDANASAYGYIQQVFMAIDANTVHVLNQAVQEL